MPWRERELSQPPSIHPIQPPPAIRSWENLRPLGTNTAIEKGHCRRRKIRCIPSPADVQGRCVNCIRLKKECSFYPVDQQPPQDTRQKSSSRSSVGPKIASASSSPAMQTGLPSDVHGQHPYPQLAMPSIQSMAPPMKPPGTESFSQEAKSKSPSQCSFSPFLSQFTELPPKKCHLAHPPLGASITAMAA